ncbi:MAG: kinase/pyrophosphorylase [Salinisphaera sp.]|jgi:regulator of PEP synthase PpsR (kinase-PPPase family)|nr:kinase/pyrophosphorylase [Salinisphaera sp.]
MTESEKPQRAIFFLSDRTGITAETLGSTLLTQFDESELRQSTLPFVNTADKARSTLAYIEHTGRASGLTPIVFSTTVSDEVRAVLRAGNIVFLDLFDMFLPSLESALDTKSTHRVGQAHGIANQDIYDSRIDAMNFALNHDDGVNEQGYERAEVILVAPSRVGKTPVCIYMAMQYGIYAANYPLTEDEFDSGQLPRALKPHRDKLYGLYIDPKRLHHIRSERRKGSQYAAIPQVSYELRQAEQLYKKHRVPYAETTHKSIEELATLIMQDKNLRRRSF